MLLPHTPRLIASAATWVAVLAVMLSPVRAALVVCPCDLSEQAHATAGQHESGCTAGSPHACCTSEEQDTEAPCDVASATSPLDGAALVGATLDGAAPEGLCGCPIGPDGCDSCACGFKAAPSVRAIAQVDSPPAAATFNDTGGVRIEFPILPTRTMVGVLVADSAHQRCVKLCRWLN